jgi:hypothetical protein
MGYGETFYHNLTVNVAELQVHATATVASTPADALYPIHSIVCDNIVGDWSAIVLNQYFRIERAGVMIFEGVTRRRYSPSRSTTLFIPRLHKGDMGLAHETAQTIQVGDVVTVYKLHLPAGFWSSINPRDYVLEKRGNLKVRSGGISSNNNHNHWPSQIARLGPWQRIEAVDGVGTVTHDASTSSAWRGKTLEYEWEIPTGGTITSGLVTDASLTVEYEPGFYVVHCELMAINEPDAEDHRFHAYRYIWVVDDTYPDFSAQYAVEPIEDATTYNEGREMQFRVGGGFDSLWIGAPVLVTYEMRHGEGYDITGTTNQATWHLQQFSGYITEYTTVEDDGDVDYVEITVSSPLRVMKREGIAPQMMITAPEDEHNWTKTIAAHMHVGWFVHWLISHHIGGILELHDFSYTDMDDWVHSGFNTDRGSIWDAIQSAASYCIGGFVACTWDGEIVVRRDLRYEITAADDSYLTGLTSITLDGDDIADRIRYTRSPLRQSFETRSGFFIASTTAPPVAKLLHSAPYAPGRGTRASTVPDFLALTAADGRNRGGQAAMIENLPTEAVGFKLASYFIDTVYDPALKQVYVTDLTAYDPLGVDLFNSGQWVLRETTLSWLLDEATQEWVFDATLKLYPLPRGQKAKREKLPPVIAMGAPEVQPFTTLDLSTFSKTRTDSGTYSAGEWVHDDYVISTDDPEGVDIAARGVEIYKAINAFVSQIEVFYELTAPLDNDLLAVNVRLMTFDPDDPLSSAFPSDIPIDSAASVTTSEAVRHIFVCTSIYIDTLAVSIFSSSVDNAAPSYSGGVTITSVRYRPAG